MVTDAERDEIRGRTDLRELVAEDAEVTRRGPVSWALCPFHDDHHPSLSVERDHYHCYACGAHGDAFDYVMGARGLTFPEAVGLLASRAGVELSGDGRDARSEAHRRDAAAAIAAVAGLAREWLAGRSDDADWARSWLAALGIDAPTVDGWGIGFVPEGMDPTAIARDAGLVAGAMRAARLVDNEGISLGGCVTFPVTDALGRVTGIVGVDPDGERTALAGTPDVTEAISVGAAHKGHVPHVRECLAGLAWARDAMRSERVALVTLTTPRAASLHAAGVRNAVSTVGGGLSVRQAGALARAGARRIVLLYPRTSAGTLAALASLPTATMPGVDVMWAPGCDGDGPPDATAILGDCANAHWLVDGVLGEIARDPGALDADGLVDAVRDACATLGCAVGDVWQAFAVARSVARAFGVLNPQALYGALLTGAEIGGVQWANLL